MTNVIQNRFTNIIDHKVFSHCDINPTNQKGNLSSFAICLENHQFDFSIIWITKTWLNDYNCDLYSLNGYNIVEAHRSGRSGGGVGFFGVNDIPYQKSLTPFQKMSDMSLFSLKFIKMHFTTIEISLLVWYTDPRIHIWSCFMIMLIFFDTLGREQKYCYLMGDFNINLLNSGKHAKTTFLLIWCMLILLS